MTNDSEYEYAEVRSHAGWLARRIMFWGTEGWELVNSAYLVDAHSPSTTAAIALLRRKRGEGQLLAPNAQRWHTDRIRVERQDDGRWSAERCNANGIVIAASHHDETEAAALESLARQALNDAEVALVAAGKPGEAMDLVRRRIGTSWNGAQNLVREHVFDFDRDKWNRQQNGDAA